MPLSMQYNTLREKQCHCMKGVISSEEKNRKDHQKTQEEYCKKNLAG